MSDLDKIVASIRRQLRDGHDDCVILYPAQWQTLLALLSQDRGEGVEKSDCGNVGWCHTPGRCSRHDVATLPSPASGEGEPSHD